MPKPRFDDAASGSRFALSRRKEGFHRVATGTRLLSSASNSMHESPGDISWSCRRQRRVSPTLAPNPELNEVSPGIIASSTW